MQISTLIHKAPLNRPGWSRTIERDGRNVLLRILNELELEVSRVFIHPDHFDMILNAIETCRKLGAGHRMMLGQMTRRNGTFYQVRAENYHGQPALGFYLHDRDGSAHGKPHSLLSNEIEALERAIVETKAEVQ